MKILPARLMCLLLAISSAYSANASPLDRRVYPVPRYELNVRVVPQDRRLEVSGVVTLPATDAARDFVPLLLNEQMKNLQVEVLGPRANAGRVALQQAAKAGARIVWLVRPATPFAAGEQISLRFSCLGAEKDSFVFSSGPEIAFAQGLISAWYPLADAGPYAGHVGSLQFTVPPGHRVIASGKLLSTPKDVLTGSNRFEVSQPSVFSFAVGRYTVVRKPGPAPQPAVSAYLLKPRAGSAAYLKTVSRVLNFLSKQFGPYPFKQFTVVEVPKEKAVGFFGASTSGFVFVPSSYIDRKFDYSLYGHEIAHQWWGAGVREGDGKGKTLLSEGMAEFGGLATVEHFEGQTVAASYRAIGYPTIGKYTIRNCAGPDISVASLRGYLMLTALGNDQRLDSLRGSANAHELAVSKGALVLNLLSRTVGPERMRHVLSRFTSEYQFREINWEKFRGAIERNGDSDMTWFFTQWFERTGAPEWQIEWAQQGGKLHGAITQAEPFYRATIEVEAVGKTRSELQRKQVEVQGARTEFDWHLPYREHAQSPLIRTSLSHIGLRNIGPRPPR